MGIAASELRCYVICRTRTFLARQTPGTDYFLLGIAASQSALKAELGTRFGLGLYSVCAELPRTFRDDYLAKHPDFANQFRGLANQHAFLPGADSELRATLGYCAAIARLMSKRVVSQCRGKMTCRRRRVFGAGYFSHVDVFRVSHQCGKHGLGLYIKPNRPFRD